VRKKEIQGDIRESGKERKKEILERKKERYKKER
jgi:hypothetical protein